MKSVLHSRFAFLLGQTKLRIIERMSVVTEAKRQQAKFGNDVSKFVRWAKDI